MSPCRVLLGPFLVHFWNFSGPGSGSANPAGVQVVNFYIPVGSTRPHGISRAGRITGRRYERKGPQGPPEWSGGLSVPVGYCSVPVQKSEKYIVTC